MRNLALLFAFSFAAQLFAQDTPAAPPASATQPAAKGVLARVIEVKGDVLWAPTAGGEWKKAVANDEYPEQTTIKTGIRSSVKLQMGDAEPYMVLVVDSVSKIEISEAFRDEQVKRVRVGLGYGRIRAGVAEGGVQSDLTVESPVATLSKRGTWNFGMYYERATDRFEIFLLDYGLVEAISKVAGTSRELAPGELVTEAMRYWADQAELDRNVAFPDILGQQDIQVAFNRITQDGLGVIDSNGGYALLLNLSNETARQNFAQQLTDALGGSNVPIVFPPGPGGVTGPIRRPEGSFGTGRGGGLVQVLIDQNNSLVRQGFARPGRYNFPRDVAQGWLNKNKR